MTKKYLFFTLSLLLSSALVFAQNGIIGQGFANGFNNPTDIQAFDASFGGSRILIKKSNATGNQFFRMVRAWNFDNTEFGPANGCPASDQDITGLSGQVVNGVSGCGTAFSISVSSTTTDYVFKTPSPDNSQEFIFFSIGGEVVSLGATAQSPAIDGLGEVPADTDVQVFTETSAPLPLGQAAYLRYTTDAFTSSTVVPMAITAARGGNAQAADILSATIPGQAGGTTVSYYVFTSGSEVVPTDADADYRTINADNNGGANFTFTTSAALPVTYAQWSATREKTDVVELAWSTETESGASHFTLERSIDNGLNWADRVSIDAENSISGSSYAYTDVGAPAGELLYRLKQTDFDESSSYSTVLTVEGATGDFSVWPQPTTIGQLYFLAPQSMEGGTADLLSLSGQVLASQQIGVGRQNFQLNKLKAGIYLIRLSAGEGRDMVKRVLVR